MKKLFNQTESWVRFLKMLSLLAFLTVFAPTTYFIIIFYRAYNVGFSEMILTMEFYFILIGILAIILIFKRNRYLILIGYLLAITVLLFKFFSTKHSSYLLLWLLLMIFISTASYVIYFQFKEKKNIDNNQLIKTLDSN